MNRQARLHFLAFFAAGVAAEVQRPFAVAAAESSSTPSSAEAEPALALEEEELALEEAELALEEAELELASSCWSWSCI